jgi:hypothetical protein
LRGIKKMKKSDKVKYISEKGIYFTPGREYEVQAAEGDVCPIFHDVITGNSAFVLKDDDGNEQFCLFPSCAHGEWEVVS